MNVADAERPDVEQGIMLFIAEADQDTKNEEIH